MSISTTELLIGIGIALLLGGTLAFLFWKERNKASKGVMKSEKERPAASLPLQLQAYERLILLSERISLPNLINRTSQPGMTARDLQLLLTQSIKQEFEHNVTQQIYVTAEAWDAVRNLKEQNIHVINQVASFLPPDASGIDLSKYLLEMLMQNPKASLHGIVSEVLSYEAKKLLS